MSKNIFQDWNEQTQVATAQKEVAKVRTVKFLTFAKVVLPKGQLVVEPSTGGKRTDGTPYAYTCWKDGIEVPAVQVRFMTSAGYTVSQRVPRLESIVDLESFLRVYPQFDLKAGDWVKIKFTGSRKAKGGFMDDLKHSDYKGRSYFELQGYYTLEKVTDLSTIDMSSDVHEDDMEFGGTETFLK